MRQYDDDEVRQLLEHATQLQQAGEPEDPEEGVTLAELLFTRLGSSLMSPGMERSEALESLVARVAGCVQPEYEGSGK